MAIAAPIVSICAATMRASSAPKAQSRCCRAYVRKTTTTVVNVAKIERMAEISVTLDCPSKEWLTSRVISSLLSFGDVGIRITPVLNQFHQAGERPCVIYETGAVGLGSLVLAVYLRMRH